MKKMIFATLMVVLAFVAMSANAQVLVEGIGMDNKSVYEYLMVNQKDTVLVSTGSSLVGADSVVIMKKAVLGGENHLVFVFDRIICKTNTSGATKIDPKTEELFAALSQVSRAYEKKLSSTDDKDVKAMEHHANHIEDRDTKYAYLKGVGSISENDTDAGKLPMLSGDKYGWSAGPYVACQIGENQSSPIVGINLNWSRKWWQSSLNLEGGKCFYTTDDSDLVKNYLAYRSELSLGLRPFQLDTFDCNRLFVVGGVGLEGYKTDNEKEVTFDKNGVGGPLTAYNEWGNSFYMTAGLKYEHRIFATGNTIYATAMWRGCEGAFSNSGSGLHHSFVISGGFNFGIKRNKLNFVKGNKGVKNIIKQQDLFNNIDL